jgi:hypothetical protein
MTYVISDAPSGLSLKFIEKFDTSKNGLRG